MAESIGTSIISVLKATNHNEDSSVYINTNELKNRIKKRRQQSTDSNQQSTRFLIPYNNKLRKIWDYTIILTAIYSTFIIPIKIAFDPPEFGAWYSVLDWLTTVIYLTDIGIQFRTTYLDNFGEEITNVTQIAKHYVMSFSFIIDLVALAANPLTESLGQIRFVGILKINRVFRLKQLITEANMDKFNKALCKIFYFAFILYVYIHLTACMWYFVI